ncbi:MAG: competence/damage-inducible protein A, partial [Planctomycetota bacterium]|nr:competence/damage-inducible protein A [Planctomycetota bacterium]
MKAAIISVGDELLRGDVADTNASTLARLLGTRGIDVTTMSVTGDTVTSLGRQLKACIDAADLVLVTGGLGPTRDDITRLAVARVVGEELRLDRSSQERIRRRFERSGKPLSEANERQALFPARAEIIDNAHGTAPGFICRSGGSTILC